MSVPADPIKRTLQDVDFPFPPSFAHKVKRSKTKSGTHKSTRLVIEKSLSDLAIFEDYPPLSKNLFDKEETKVTVIHSPPKEKILKENIETNAITQLSSKMAIPKQKVQKPLAKKIKQIKADGPALAPKKSEAEIVTEHAALRINLIYQALVVYWQKAVRSDGTCRDFEVSVRGSDMQLGQAHRYHYHAAHAFPASGLVDTLWNQMIREKQDEQKLTPRKEMILQSLHEAHYKLQNQLLDPEKKGSALNEGTKRALWSSTPAWVGMNRTTIVHTNVNLIVDKGLENEVRAELIPELVKLSAEGKQEPHHLTKIFVEKAQSHFESKIQEYRDHITLINNSTEKGLKADIAYYERLIMLTEAAYKGTVEPQYEEIFGKIDPVTMQKVMLTGDELFKRSLEVLKQFLPERH